MTLSIDLDSTGLIQQFRLHSFVPNKALLRQLIRHLFRTCSNIHSESGFQIDLCAMYNVH